MKKNYFLQILSFLILILMICFPKLTFSGAKNGLLLWYNSFLPAVFPFMIISGILTNYLKNSGIAFGIIAGFMSGFPNGSKIAYDLYERNLISKHKACYIAIFCNMSSPMFMAAYARVGTFLPLIYSVSFLLIIICFYYKKITSEKEIFIHSSKFERIYKDSGKHLIECSEIMVIAGIYIMYFSIFIVWLNSLISPKNPMYIFIPLLELTTGINMIDSMSFLPEKNIFIYKIFLCVFGGFSTIFQTSHIIKKLNLSVFKYSFFKVLQACIISFLCFLII